MFFTQNESATEMGTLLLAQAAGGAQISGISFLIVFGFIFLISMALFGFWVLMLVDCLKNEPSEGNDKIVWLLVIILLNWVGALIYLLVRRKDRINQTGK